jgi:hypothetical protein
VDDEAKSEGAGAFFAKRAIRAAGVTELVEIDAAGSSKPEIDVAVVLADGPGRPKDVPAFFVSVEPSEIPLAAHPVARDAARLRSVAAEEPLLRGVALDELTTLRAKVATPSQKTRTLVELDGGPTLVSGGSGKTSWVWLGIDPEQSDLVLRVAFPVLVANVLTHLGGSAQVIAAKTAPRAEVMLAPPETRTPLPSAPDPRWRVPFAPATAIAALGALLLGLEAWFTFRRRLAR